jgi:two-component system, NarL family, response regulator NreC
MQIKVWLADDHAMFRSGLRALLEREDGITVVGETGSGYDTLNALKTAQIDVLLLDINMPGLSGMRVAELAIKERPKLLIVVLTMHEDEYYIQQLFKLGVRGYVLKKSTGTEVMQAIRAVYRGDNYIDPALADLMISSYVGRNSAKRQNCVDFLSRREQEVLELLVHGFTNLEIADRLSISDRTVETHRANINGKLELKSRADLVRFAIDNGLLKAI